MLLSVSIAVLNMIALVFERIEGLVFDLPSGATTPHQLPYFLFGNGHIGYPAVMIGDFSFTAMISQSCFTYPSVFRMDSGKRGITWQIS
jgi:hypothetical protein